MKKLMRHLPAIIATALLVLCLATDGFAAEAVKKLSRDYVPPPDDPTVGSLVRPNRDAAARRAESSQPPAKIPGVVVPKVDAGSAVVPGLQQANPSLPPMSSSPSQPSSSPSSLPAAPRTAVSPDGGGTADGIATPAQGVAVQPPSGLLSRQPFLAGLVAGLVGTDLGSVLYGGTMQGDENGAVIGYAVRMALVVLLVLLVVRSIKRAIGRSSDEDYAPPPVRREPNFEAGRAPSTGGRREPSFSREQSFDRGMHADRGRF
ncbi:MAG: hypothetical protein VB101_07080 [Rhodospirillaceae bacterium]|nr:hypothetical protein [Rhodospirillaceae bacterium]